MAFSFRKKIITTHLVIFLFFAIFLYPLTTRIVEHIHRQHLFKQVDGLINDIQTASSVFQMVEKLKIREKLLFFRLTLYDPRQGYLFDTHLDVTSPDILSSSQSMPEIEKAMRKGAGYEVHYSELFGQQMAYIARRFIFKENAYVLRAAFPNGQILSLVKNLTISYVGFVLALFLIFIGVANFIVHQLTKPVFRILEAIRLYQEGKEEALPQIEIGSQIGEFGQLADTLNSLSKQLQKQIERLIREKNEKSAILESLIEGVIAVDRNLVITYMNRMSEIFLDIDHLDFIGQPFSLLDQPICEELLKSAQQTKEPVLSVMKIGRKRSRVFDLVATSLTDEGAILVLQDKTSLHRVIEMGRDFVANSSHELKTPITVIRGFAETLHDHPELSREVCKEITYKIVNHCIRMETLVKNLLTLAALDEGLPDSRLQDCDLIQLMMHAKQTILEVHPKAKIEVEAVGAKPFVLRLDQDLFFQAILNLLDNAAKYSKGSAKITLRVIKGKEEYMIQIIDRGVGIPREDLDRIFERFYAVDKSHSRSLGGSGLGLSIVEKIIEKHQGKIEVKSEVNQGTTFMITLPSRKDEYTDPE